MGRYSHAMWQRKQNGWSKKHFNAMMEAQNKRCAICGFLLCDSRPHKEKLPPHLRKLAADHNHKTGNPRGILCQSCNSMLGMAGDDPEILRKAASYLEYYT